MDLILPVIFTLFMAPNATDLALETQADDFNSYSTVQACEADLEIMQMKNPSLYFWCE